MDKPLGQPARALKVDDNTPPSGSGAVYTNDDISISLVVNARGRACLLHDRPFVGTPTWLKYMVNKRKVKIVFDNGTEYVIDYTMNDKLHGMLLNMAKVFVIRVEDGRPQEGYDTTLIKE